jgi:hypothetical protein
VGNHKGMRGVHWSSKTFSMMLSKAQLNSQNMIVW